MIVHRKSIKRINLVYQHGNGECVDECVTGGS